MRLLSYKYSSENDHWDFERTKLNKINLIVGDSGSGKSRFINTIDNFSKMVTTGAFFHPGSWDVTLLISETYYSWSITTKFSEDNGIKVVIVEKETLKYGNSLDSLITLVNRDENNITFKGDKLPKLSRAISIINLLKEEDIISDLFNGFKQLLTRRFSTDELIKNFGFFEANKDQLSKIIHTKSLDLVFKQDLGFSNKIYLLKEINHSKYNELINYYKEVFPFISDFRISNQVINPTKGFPGIQCKVLSFKENHIDQWIPVNDISSGMQKVFLLALDIFLMEKGGILIIDEYENSLGVSALNTLPELVENTSNECQFILTSHHPYIINNISEKNWLGFSRKGNKVSIKHGDEFYEEYKHSNQDKFIQLLNDISYSEGIE